MTLKLDVSTAIEQIWDSEVEEVILSTNSGKIGILPDHKDILTALDIGITKARVDNQWIAITIFGGIAEVRNNIVTIVTVDAQKASDINLEEAESNLALAQENLNKATSLKEKIEANLILEKSKVRLEAAQSLVA
jgi:F-type H+-transporting ATPase subunit epsilon